MRILEVAPLVSPIDETGEQLGGAQVLVADLARGLAARGHEVTLAAANGSRVSGVRIAPLDIDSGELRPAALGVTAAERLDTALQARAFARVQAWLETRRDAFDVAHAHAYDAPAFELLTAPQPVIHTLHLPPYEAGVVRAARAATAAITVTVSEANARAWREAGVPVRHVIYNGVDVTSIHVGERKGPHLLCAGRISPEKGVHLAIALARRLGRSLLIVGGIYDQAYFDELVSPHARAMPTWRTGDDVDGIVWIGSRRREEVHALMGDAAATLMPVLWDEPFGLVAVESLAAGTPVAGFRRGGLAEIVDDSCGALAEPDDERALERATFKALACSPGACRRRAERFSLDAMLSGYEELFAEVRSDRRGTHGEG
ncbi:MAG: glycosyltransferase [Chloroflexi bacterium]|nr:glycosyltransferase [Chloroflexota bacterium]